MKAIPPPKHIVIGNVTNQAITIFWATPHLTAENRLAAPTPMMEVVITWVVLTGAPMKEALSITKA